MTDFQNFLQIVIEECAKQGLDQPHIAYYQCGQICGTILMAAEQLGILGFELLTAEVKYPDKTDYSEEDGLYAKHFLLRHGSILYDFTLRQFLPESLFPYISDGSHSKIYRNLRVSENYSYVYSFTKESSANSTLADSIVSRFLTEKSSV